LRARTEELLNQTMAARAAQATPEGFKDFTRELRQKIK
jgi:hypothetical protein